MSDGGKGDKRRPGDDAAFDEGFDRIFGQKKPERGRFIWDKETHELVPADRYYRPQDSANAPMVMADISPYQSQVDGSMIQGRRQHREHLRQHNLIEVGNETKHLKPYGTYKPSGVKEDLIRAVHQVRDRERK